MKAILEYGKFTCLIELPQVLPEIRIMKPTDAITFVPQDVPDVTEVHTKLLEFSYARQLDGEYHLYRFWREL